MAAQARAAVQDLQAKKSLVEKRCGLACFALTLLFECILALILSYCGENRGRNAKRARES